MPLDLNLLIKLPVVAYNHFDWKLLFNEVFLKLGLVLLIKKL